MAAGDVITVNEDLISKKANLFDGTDDYVLADAHAVARVAAADTVGTYSAWIYLDSLTTSSILSVGDNDSATEYILFRVDGSGLLEILLRHGGADQFDVRQTAVSIVAKTWTHVAVVQNGVQPVLYINGLAVTTTNVTATDLTDWYNKITLGDKFAIGIFESNGTHTQDFKGAIGQVKYFNIALSAKEMLTEYNGGSHTTDSGAVRAALIETARVFDITCDEDGTTDDGSGADNGTLTGDAHYGGEVSNFSQAIERNVTGHAAETLNVIETGQRYIGIIKRGD